MDKKTIFTNTSSGTVALFEPAQISFEENFSEEFYTCLTYFKEGSLILFGIGGDGPVGMSVSIEEGPTISKGSSFSGRLKVVTGKLFFGPGESLPHDGRPFREDDFEGEWIDIAPGYYRYVISSIEDSDSADVSLSCTFSPVDSLEEVDYPKKNIPYLEA